MPTNNDSTPIQSFTIRQEVLIRASCEIAFEALLEELGPGSELPDGKPFPMKLEPRPGGRWYRDLGEASGHAYGHLWGHVQVIKAPVLLELTGPMAMSYAAANHIQYRLRAQGAETLLTLVHTTMGFIPPEHAQEMPKGWAHGLSRVKLVAENRSAM